MKRRNARDPLDPKAARQAGVDNEGTLWVDGNAKGIRSAVTSEAFREGWERTFGFGKKRASLKD